MTRGLCEMTLEARDLSRLEDFYRRAFGWPLISRADDRIWLSCGTHARVGIWTPGRKEFGDRGGRHVHFALSAGRAELDGLCGRLDELGFEHRGPIEHPGGDRSVYVEDPEGNVVEVWDFFHRGEGAEHGTEAFKAA
jgi:catechol-2,3-dioxygenase